MDLSNILVFRIGNLGDTVMALPAFWAIRNSFPNARLTLLTNSDPRNRHYLTPRSVLPEDGLIDEWISYPNPSGLLDKATSFYRLARELRRRDFDVAIYLMPRIRTEKQIDRDVCFFRFCGIRRLIGAEYLRQNSLTASIPKPTPFVESESEFLLNLLSAEGLSVQGYEAKTDLLLSDTEILSARNWLSESISHANICKKLVAVAPGSKWASKIWDEARYQEVVARLILEKGCYPVIFGGEEDHAIGERLIAVWGTGSNAAGELNVRESAALLTECAIYLGNDTGTMHLAAAVGTPCIAIFAAIDWKGRWWPSGEGHRIFRQTVECEGCFTPYCFNDHKCLRLTTTGKVYEACNELLDQI